MIERSADMKVLKGGTLIDGTGAGSVAGATIVIRDQRIEAVTVRAGGDWPSDAEIIDVSGMTILPGLIDCTIIWRCTAMIWRGAGESTSRKARELCAPPRCCKRPSRRDTPRCAMRPGSTPVSNVQSTKV